MYMYIYVALKGFYRVHHPLPGSSRSCDFRGFRVSLWARRFEHCALGFGSGTLRDVDYGFRLYNWNLRCDLLRP